jgi:ribosomal protein L29
MADSMKELRVKERAEILKLLQENRAELRRLKAKAAAQDLKNVRSIRSLKRFIARLATRLNEFTAEQTK